MTEKQLRQKVVDTAVAWLGCKEANGSHRKIIDLYNAHKPLARGYAVKYTDAWCATFVSAVAIKAGMTDIIPLECGCGKMIEPFTKLGRWQENDAYTPAAGDVIFYDWDDNGVGDCKGAADHVGIVLYAIGNNMKIIEGNKNDAVAYRTMTVDGKFVRGYGLPDYAGKAAGPVNAAIKKLAGMGVINSPDYWTKTVAAGTVKHLDTLLIKSAEKITRAGARASTPENGIGNLVAAGSNNTPDYWLSVYHTVRNLGALLCALGGAVK